MRVVAARRAQRLKAKYIMRILLVEDDEMIGEGGRIEIGLSEEKGDALITVTDNGPGIAPEERQRVFERFYRALGTKVQGTGLGLAIVQRIVNIHGAEIRIEDGFKHENDDGCGARFVIRLPLTRTTLH